MPEETKFRERRSKGKMKSNLEKVNFLKNQKTIKERGITLIALVVTIVVLLILASVSITVVFGDNGLIEMAREAANKTNEAVENDQTMLNDLSEYLGNVLTEESSGGNTQETLPPKEPTMKVELTVDEVQVTGEKIPVTAKVTKIDDGTPVTEGITYEFYKNDTSEGVDSSTTHTFNNLDNTKSYTLKCKVEDSDGNIGTGEITVLSFSVDGSYYRATEGMTWESWCSSDYDTTCPASIIEKEPKCEGLKLMETGANQICSLYGWVFIEFDEDWWQHGYFVWYEDERCIPDSITKPIDYYSYPIIRSETSYSAVLDSFYGGE